MIHLAQTSINHRTIYIYIELILFLKTSLINFQLAFCKSNIWMFAGWIPCFCWLYKPILSIFSVPTPVPTAPRSRRISRRATRAVAAPAAAMWVISKQRCGAWVAVISWRFPKPWGYPFIAGCVIDVYFMEHPKIEWMRTGGTPILGNLHVYYLLQGEVP